MASVSYIAALPASTRAEVLTPNCAIVQAGETPERFALHVDIAPDEPAGLNARRTRACRRGEGNCVWSRATLPLGSPYFCLGAPPGRNRSGTVAAPVATVQQWLRVATASSTSITPAVSRQISSSSTARCWRTDSLDAVRAEHLDCYSRWWSERVAMRIRLFTDASLTGNLCGQAQRQHAPTRANHDR
jgi:hypothetical protein